MFYTTHLLTILLCLAPGMVTSLCAQDVKPSDLSPEEFLQLARRPFRQEAWAELSGTVQHKDAEGLVEAPLRLAVLMHPEYLRAQFVLGKLDVYDVTQAYADDGVSNVRVEPPDKFATVTLQELGVNVEDITFSFLYWDLVKELEGRRVRGQQCRVMRLRNPHTLDVVTVCFSSKYVGPLRVEYYEGKSKTPTRWLEFTDFKREGELYYVRTAQLRGKNWKTQVKFSKADLALASDRLPPEHLFVAD